MWRAYIQDPSLAGAIAEQIRRLNQLDIPFEICPRRTYAAAAAAMGTELTIPVTQSIILTRTAISHRRCQRVRI